MSCPNRLALAVLAACVGLPAPSDADGGPAAIRGKAHAWRKAHEREIVDELSTLLAVPNHASARGDIRRNADLLLAMLARHGLSARLLEAKGNPAVYAELLTPGATRTVVLYAHYDGQAVDPAAWAGDPWKPVLRDKPVEKGGREVTRPASGRFDPEWRLYGRSASDDKGPIVGILAALDALRAAGIPLSVNLKLFFEGEEEAGSPHLRAMLIRHARLLAGDLWLFCDGPVDQSGAKQLAFGARGMLGLEMTVYGPNRVLHSGHYGNWAPNPVALLVHLLTSMRSRAGEILVDGLASQVAPISDAERKALASVPDNEAALLRSLDLAAPEGKGRLGERILVPALNLRGISAGGVGSLTTNSIPTHAVASLDLRLVPRQTVDHVKARVEEHVRRQGYHVVHEDPTPATRRAHPLIVKLDWQPGYPGYRTPVDSPLALAVVKAVEEGAGARVARLPGAGGSLPLYVFDEVLHVPVITLPIVNHDNNQHAANENLRLGNLWDGIEIYAVLLARLGQLWPKAGSP